MKQRIVINGPCYKNEFSIYTKETLDKIEGFRRARTHWLSVAEENQKTLAKVKEGMKESNVYTGRCSCLRKMRLKTTLLRFRYKDFKPHRFWTFRKKLTEQDMEAYDKIEKQALTEEKPKRKESSTVCSSPEYYRREDLEQCLRDADKIRGRVRRKQAKLDCKEREVSGPCKKALKRLKAAKIRDGMVESCKCEDGREVTVVIKGICLCDTSPLGKVNLNKVCDEYNRMLKQPTRPVEGPSGDVEKEKKGTNTSNRNQESTDKADGKIEHLYGADSAETYRRVKSSHEVEIGNMATETKKKLTFENEENLKGDGGERRPTKSEITLYRKLSSEPLDLTSTDVRPKTEPTTSNLLAVKGLLNYDSIVDVSKPFGAPRTASMNNLLVDEDVKTKAKRQLLGINKRFESPQIKSLSNPFAYEDMRTKAKRQLLGINKPFEAPLSESVNNTFANQDMKTKAKRQVLGINKPFEVPQSESLNNLLVNEDMKTTPTGQSKKYPATSLGKLPDENVRPWEPVHASNSLEIYKKQWKKHDHKMEEDLGKYDKTIERKTKVRLNRKPTIIPPSDVSLEKIPSPHPEKESPAKPVETHDVVTHTKSWNEKSELESKSRVSVGSEQTAEADADMDDKSIVTLYKNQPAEKSEMALTKEEYERMKEVEREDPKNEKINKKNEEKITTTVSAV